jgi:hypothetical protein
MIYMMKKLPVLILISVLFSLSLTGCLSDKDRLVGTWQYSEGGTITFYGNNTVTIQNIGPLVAVSLNGVFTYSLTDHNITFASRGSTGITFTFAYSFPNDTTLILTRSNTQLTLTKVK